ncbi:DUF1778 domain-containing protein [Gilvimarinus sp. SDUM040013]|uniref:DUF1778 domain-containing protein n=1 Tax=Gilvimarinus gilvus TaxID=3058038 RepID=A0ABU4S2J3_9GAMM|nr:DUF1778 domain-containing protein [Gilvimarinus sp. SDUM040013]MDO3387979.1 DUF1778 domain-containing protein [Gilvimarinus sp. SDUM040013]MDX6851240.1 DUF1778 domain-containing protein [Gilvimarinus sp. SDUM040013]
MATKTERIEARFPAELKILAERAALASGYSLTDYLANLVRNDAIERLKSQSEIQLTNERFDRFAQACEDAKAPSNKIIEAAEKLDREGF